MRKSTLISVVLLLIGMLAAGPSFAAKGRFWAHGNNKLGKSTLSIRQARVAVANAINQKLGPQGKRFHLRVKPEQIQISLKKAADGRVLFSAKLRADGRTRAAKIFKTTAEFRGTLDVSTQKPSRDAIAKAAYALSEKPGRGGRGKAQNTANWLEAERSLTVAPDAASRVKFFEGNKAGAFNNLAKTLK